MIIQTEEKVVLVQQVDNEKMDILTNSTDTYIPDWWINTNSEKQNGQQRY